MSAKGVADSVVGAQGDMGGGWGVDFKSTSA